jgi:hypothetical protein
MASDFSAVITDDRSSPNALCCGVTKVAAHVTNRGRCYGACSSVCELGDYRGTNRQGRGNERIYVDWVALGAFFIGFGIGQRRSRSREGGRDVSRCLGERDGFRRTAATERSGRR